MEDAKMSRRIPAPQFGDPIGPFRPHFAWAPVKTYDGWNVWLKTVMRRRIQKHDHLVGGANFWWQYAMREDLR